MSKFRPPLSTTPDGIVESLLAHINTLDVDIMFGFYDNEGILIDASGQPQVGADAIKVELAKYFKLGLPMEIRARHIYVAGGIASLVLDWSIIGTTIDGVKVEMIATAYDTARLGSDGYWRYLIDNPFGTQIRSST